MLSTFSWSTFILGTFLLGLSFQTRGPRHKQLLVDYSIYRDILDLALEIRKEVGDCAEKLSARRLDTYIKTSTGKVQIAEDIPLVSRVEDLDNSASTSSKPRAAPGLTSPRALYSSRPSKFPFWRGTSGGEEKALIDTVKEGKDSVPSTASSRWRS